MDVDSSAFGEPAVATDHIDPVKILSVGLAIRWFGNSFFAPFILIYLHVDLGLSFAVAGLYLVIPGAATLGAPLLGGGLTDRFGRKIFIVSSLGAEAVGLSVFAAGIHLGSIVAVFSGLSLASAASGVGFPSVSAYLADVTIPARRALGFAWQRSAFNAGVAGGTAVGGLLLTYVSFFEIALLAVGVTIVGVLFSVVLLPQSPRDLRAVGSRLDQEPGPDLKGNSPVPSASMFATAVKAPLLAVRRDRALLLCCLATGFLFVMIIQYDYAIPTFARTSLGLPFAFIGVAIALNGALPAFTQIPLTRGLMGRSITRVGLWGVVSYAAAYLAMGVEGDARTLPVVALFVVVIVMTLGENLVAIPIFTLPMKIAPEDTRGAYSGASTTAVNLGVLGAPVLAGFALSLSIQPFLVWLLMAIPCVPAAWLLWRLSRVIPSGADTV